MMQRDLRQLLGMAHRRFNEQDQRVANMLKFFDGEQLLDYAIVLNEGRTPMLPTDNPDQFVGVLAAGSILREVNRRFEAEALETDAQDASSRDARG